MSDFHRTLDVPENASRTQIKAQHRKLVRLVHPDRYEDPDAKAYAEQRLKEINQAYQALLHTTAAEHHAIVRWAASATPEQVLRGWRLIARKLLPLYNYQDSGAVVWMGIFLLLLAGIIGWTLAPSVSIGRQPIAVANVPRLALAAAEGGRSVASTAASAPIVLPPAVPLASNAAITNATPPCRFCPAPAWLRLQPSTNPAQRPLIVATPLVLVMPSLPDMALQLLTQPAVSFRQPTASPTQTPTLLPTATPSSSPTISPTVTPKQTATSSPTPLPVTPTQIPTETPAIAFGVQPLHGGILVTIVSLRNANVRAATTTESSIVTLLPTGSTVEAVGRTIDNNWVRVVLPDSRLGWVFATLLVPQGATIDQLPIFASNQ